MAQNARRDLESRRWRMRPARRRAVARHLQVRRASRGLNTGCRGLPLSPDSLAAVSTPAAEIHSCGPPPSLRTGCCLYAGGQEQPLLPPRWPDSLAAVSTLAAEIRRGGPPPSLRSRRRQIRRGGSTPSPRSRRRQPGFAAVARLPPCALDAGGRDPPRWPGRDPQRWPDFLAALSTPSPWSRRRRPRTASFSHLAFRGFDAGDRDLPRWPAVSTPAAEDRRGVLQPSQPVTTCLFF
jgi:hypothetical protein